MFHLSKKTAKFCHTACLRSFLIVGYYALSLPLSRNQYPPRLRSLLPSMVCIKIYGIQVVYILTLIRVAGGVYDSQNFEQA
jgi:hypothetical protein